MIKEYLKEKNLIICPNYLKKVIISEINDLDKLYQYKIMSLEDFRKKYFFSYSKKTIYYLYKKLNLKIDIILEYLECMCYVEDKKYSSDKLNKLSKLKKELLDNKLLEVNTIFRKSLYDTNIILYGYNYIDNFYLNILSKCNFNHVKIKNNSKKINIYHFDHIDDEIIYICHDIKEKLDSGININNIKIINPTSEYLLPLKRIFNLAKIPLNIKNNISIYDLEIGKYILNLVKENVSLNEIISKIDNELKNDIINLFNNYIDIDCEVYELYDLIEYDLKHTFIKGERLDNVIDTVSPLEVNSDNYVYLVGFNKENYPKIYKDDDLLSDLEKLELNLFTSKEKNINSILELKNNIYSINNLTISYKDKDNFNTYNKSSLIDEFIIISNPSVSYRISNRLNRVILAREYDKYYKYGILSNTLNLLSNNYKDINYLSYDNKFTGIDNKLLLSSLSDPYTLSYSSIDEYYRCSFRFYLKYILNITDIEKDEFYMQIGNIFHYVLSVCFNDDFDFDLSFNKEASKYDFNISKLIFLDKLKEELKYDIEIIKKQNLLTTFNNSYYEKRFSVPISNNKGKNLIFTGVIDKILYREYDNHTLVSIIDYKTGNLKTEINNIIYGIGMQLPIYLYFVKRSNLFPNINIVGFYLQKVINKEIKKDPNKSFEEQKSNALKLVGYSTDYEEYLEKFDISYSDSNMIHGLKKKKEGFYNYSKVLNSKQIYNMDKLVESKIHDASNSILNGEFDINPKKVGTSNIGCEFCSYRDICFKSEKDIVEVEKHSNLDFLGGDSDAKLDY